MFVPKVKDDLRCLKMGIQLVGCRDVPKKRTQENGLFHLGGDEENHKTGIN